MGGSNVIFIASKALLWSGRLVGTIYGCAGLWLLTGSMASFRVARRRLRWGCWKEVFVIPKCCCLTTADGESGDWDGFESCSKRREYFLNEEDEACAPNFLVRASGKFSLEEG